VPTTTDSQRQLVLARKVDSSDHIGNVHTADDQRGVPVDHAVVNLANLLVANITGMKQRAAQAGCQLLNRRFRQSDHGVLLFHHAFLLP